ncbi:hypothetical protein ACGFX4_08965 [Kitasatospora sp. NPDC048365]|uniref:hypothetical protein n=1 Tax=Kitasatospora sp. NPDC048365 TaxID=3364050 RepID=UPI00371AA4A8
MSGGFQAHPDRLDEAAKQAHEHADKVDEHARTLGSRTGGRSLGRGKFGAIVDNAVRPIVDSMIHDMGRAMAKGHRSIGHGLELTGRRLEEAERSLAKDLKAAGHDVEPGRSPLGADGLRDAYRRRVDERVAELDRQGHGPGRHLNVSDQQLKDRLGVPITEKRKVQDPPILNDRGFPIKKGKSRMVDMPARDADGYISSEKKIDPLHGPNARSRPEDVRYDDHEVRNKETGLPEPHRCEKYSSAFNDNESYMYADQHARGRLDPNKQEPQEFEFGPEEAWGPGDHRGRFRGFFIDPQNPVGADGAVNYRDVDFSNARIKAIYEPDGNGGFRLKTMFPVPSDDHNRP